MKTMKITVVVSVENSEEVFEIFDAVAEYCTNSEGQMIYEGGQAIVSDNGE
jgi:hypothetical protein